MTRLANAHWRAAPSTSALRKVAVWAGITLLGILAALYLAGYFFLWSFHVNPRVATPLTIIQYQHYSSGDPRIRSRIRLCCCLSFVFVAAQVGVLAWPKPRALHGDARFAYTREMVQAGLFADEGIILGKLGRRYLILPGQQSVILAAPPRSGKDVGICVPNGLSWSGSLVQTDIKRENWNLTAGFRAACGQSCFRFEPLNADGDTAHSNALSYVSNVPKRRINDVQRIADQLYPETPGTDPFWLASARSLFVGICLYLFETPLLPKTIGEVRRQGMASDDEGFGAHWKRIVQGRQKGRIPLSDECVRALFDVIDLAPVTASSVRKTFTSRLDLWANPLLDAATSSDDFDLRELRKKPMSIYVCVNPDDLHRLRPILSLFFQQCIGLQTNELPEHNPALKYPVLMLLNEFSALGKIPIVSESMSYLPGYNVRVLLVIQAPSQLREVYGPYAAETMTKSVAARIVFAPRDFADAKEISEELGNTTVRVRSESRSAISLDRKASRQRSTTSSPHARPLMLPQEVKEIGTEAALILYEGLRPIRCQKIRYYLDRTFMKRLLPAPRHAVPDGWVTAPSQKAVPPEPVLPAAPTNAPVRPTPQTQEIAVENSEAFAPVTVEELPEALRNMTFEHAGSRPTDEEIKADVQKFIDGVLAS
jgi:type IV secretion system protein VirD4